MDPIRWIFEALVRELLPSGRHRTGRGAVRMHVGQPTAVPAARPKPRTAGPVLRGEDAGHVRPYLVMYERQQEEARKCTRRRALLLAVHGIDVSPRVIHGVQVTG